MLNIWALDLRSCTLKMETHRGLASLDPTDEGKNKQSVISQFFVKTP